MKRIYKYEIPLIAISYVVMPQSAKLLKIGFQEEALFVWALVDVELPLCDRHFRIIGTGWDYHIKIGEYIDTVFQSNGLVWHIFDAGEK